VLLLEISFLLLNKFCYFTILYEHYDLLEYYCYDIIQDYSGQYKNRQIINNKLLLIVLFGKLYKLYGHALEIIGRKNK
jgi:hypothetical protein